MPNFLNNLPYKANGNILPSSFIARDSSGDYLCRQATAGDQFIIGIAADDTNSPPNIDVALLGVTATQYHAVAGQSPRIYSEGDYCKVQLGASACGPGAWLTSDANGLAAPTTTTGTWVGAWAVQGGNSGELIDVVIKVCKI